MRGGVCRGGAGGDNLDSNSDIHYQKSRVGNFSLDGCGPGRQGVERPPIFSGHH